VLRKSSRLSLADVLREKTREGSLYVQEEEGVIHCVACAHECRLTEGKAGICLVRFVRDGKLYVPWGYVAGGIACDPIEKKPFFHAYPGRNAVSFGMLGCNFHCAFCQNWLTSQAVRDQSPYVSPHPMDADAIVQVALEHDAPVLSSTYNEPLITSEWAMEIFKKGHVHGLEGSYVSNGHATPQVLEFIRPYTRLCNVDLKAFQEETYRKLGGRLEAVLDTVRRLHSMDFWIEIITLVVPGLNDSPDELRQIADFVASVSPDIPWHVTAFHADYRMTDARNTPAEKLLEAAEIGYAAGLRYVYTGNLPSRTRNLESTFCHSCRALLIERYGYFIRRVRLQDGKCPDCGSVIPGVW
jgi:pyruvate formate lyase activating enzyme